MDSNKGKFNKSDAIWINNKKNSNGNYRLSNDKYHRSNSSDFRNSFDSGFDGDLSHSYGSIRQTPEFKRSFSTNSYSHNKYNDKYTDVNTRRRTMTVANDDRDSFFPFAFGFNNHHQSPFKRSNSISNGSLGNDLNIGGIIKRSMGQLFNAATVNTSLATANIQKSVPKVKCISTVEQMRKNGTDREHITDHMVSYLCENAIR